MKLSQLLNLNDSEILLHIFRACIAEAHPTKKLGKRKGNELETPKDDFHRVKWTLKEMEGMRCSLQDL